MIGEQEEVYQRNKPKVFVTPFKFSITRLCNNQTASIFCLQGAVGFSDQMAPPTPKPPTQTQVRWRDQQDGLKLQLSPVTEERPFARALGLAIAERHARKQEHAFTDDFLPQ